MKRGKKSSIKVNPGEKNKTNHASMFIIIINVVLGKLEGHSLHTGPEMIPSFPENVASIIKT